MWNVHAPKFLVLFKANIGFKNVHISSSLIDFIIFFTVVALPRRDYCVTHLTKKYCQSHRQWFSLWWVYLLWPVGVYWLIRARNKAIVRETSANFEFFPRSLLFPSEPLVFLDKRHADINKTITQMWLARQKEII